MSKPAETESTKPPATVGDILPPAAPVVESPAPAPVVESTAPVAPVDKTPAPVDASDNAPDFFPESENVPPRPAFVFDSAPPPPGIADIETAPSAADVRQGKKGRHAKDCPCAKCVAKRTGPAAAPNNANQPFQDIFAAPTNKPVDYMAMSGLVFDMSTNVLSMSLGKEWQPQNADERKMVVSSLADYMKSKEVKDVPPGMLLCFVIFAYSAPRFQAPTTSSKMKLAYHWTRNKISNFFGIFRRRRFSPEIVTYKERSKNVESEVESVN